MGKIICTIKSWWEEQKGQAQDLFQTLYAFYTAPVDADPAFVPVYPQQMPYGYPQE